MIDTSNLVLEKLARLSSLGATERLAIAALPYRAEEVPASKLLVREGDTPRDCCVLLRGFACRHKTTREGARQIVSFHLAGDILDAQHLRLERADHTVQTLSAGEVAWIPKRALNDIIEAHPKIRDAIWRESLIDASIFREWVLNVGRRDAKTRIAHLLCEFAARREAAGLGPPESFELPMTQEVIADATGLTVVHVNRSLGALARDGLITRSGRKINIADWSAMQKAADLEAAYLRLAA